MSVFMINTATPKSMTAYLLMATRNGEKWNNICLSIKRYKDAVLTKYRKLKLIDKSDYICSINKLNLIIPYYRKRIIGCIEIREQKTSKEC